jgi:penicillin-binding protein 1C
LKLPIRYPKCLRPRVRSLLIAAASLAAVWVIAPYFAPLPPALMENPGASPVFLDRHGERLETLPLADSTRSTPVTTAELPHDLIACTMAAEDKRFLRHGGVDLLATSRAARDFLRHRRIISGASTITQQLIKISSPPARRVPMTKVREALAARRLERIWTKEQILTAYLNRLDYGNLRTGAAEASRFYFQKPLAELSLAESALLAGLPQAPSRLNPLRHPQRALKRRDVVLRRLAANEMADPQRIEAALAEPLHLRPLREPRPAPWLANLTPPPPDPASRTSTAAGFKIPTTLDLGIQRDLEAIVGEETRRLNHANLRHAAVVVIHNPTGELLALVSSSDWDDPRGGQINGALAPRSPGSALKPFTYLLALERNHRSPASILADVPTPFRTPQGLGLPENYDRTYRGPVTLRTALACSLNLPAMRELNALGGPAPLHQLLESLGITTLGSDPDLHGLGLTLGNAPVRLLELSTAYATLARLGRHLPTRLFPHDPAPSPATSEIQFPFAPESFLLIADILADPAARAPAFPPGSPLDLPFRCAVKTGTSSNFRDNWCIGYTPEFTVGVWAGNFESQPMKNLPGTAGAGPIFQRAMLRLHRKHAPTWFDAHPGLRQVTIDARNGKLIPSDPTAHQQPHARVDWVQPDRCPPVAAATDYDRSGKALLDPAFHEWFHSSHNQRRGELAMDPLPAVITPLRIISPANGTTFLLDPEIPSGSDKLRPVTNHPGAADWSSVSLHIEAASPEPVIHLTPGTHTLTATDRRTGATHEVTIHVTHL